MFHQSTIPQVIDVLARRQASLWHACQLSDLYGYLKLGTIVSRGTLERAEFLLADQASDAVDRRNGYSDRIFFNLDDTGRGFSRGWNMLPNVFGPIALQVSPEALRDVESAAVCLRPASAGGFDINTDALRSADEVELLFLHDADVGFPLSAEVRFGERLREAFPSVSASTVEVMTASNPDAIPLDHIVAVWVDPVTVDDRQLIDFVDGLATKHQVPLRVRRRTLTHSSRAVVWSDIVRVLADGHQPLIRVINRADTSQAFREWAAALQRSKQDWLWDRFANYLYHGTIRHMTFDSVTPGEEQRVADRA